MHSLIHPPLHRLAAVTNDRPFDTLIPPPARRRDFGKGPLGLACERETLAIAGAVALRGYPMAKWPRLMTQDAHQFARICKRSLMAESSRSRTDQEASGAPYRV